MSILSLSRFASPWQWSPFISHPDYVVAMVVNSMFSFFLLSVLLLIYAFSLWQVFTKAGRPGWHALIPGYNLYVLVKLSGRSGWWTLGFLVPVFSIVARIVVFMDLAKKFGREEGFGLGLALFGFIFFPILAFGDAQYEDLLPSPHTFINEEGELIEEIPLEDWD